MQQRERGIWRQGRCKKNTEKHRKNRKKQKKGETPHVWMPEWSKGADLRSAVFARVGSNPTPDIFFFASPRTKKKIEANYG